MTPRDQITLRDNELARRIDGRVWLRSTPLRLRWTFDRLVSKDGHELRVQFSCSVSALPQTTERKMLEESLLAGRPSATDEDVVNHFRPPLQAAAAQAALRRDGGDWLTDGAASELRETLHKTASRIAFDTGVEVLPPLTVDIDSPTYRQQLVAARQQAINDQRTAEQLEQLQRAGAMLKEFESLRKSSPEISPGKILEQLNPSDRGELLRTTFLSAANAHANRPLWAVAGTTLLRFDVIGDGVKSQNFELPITLGPFRSVQVDGTDRAHLLIGARAGVIRIDPQAPHKAELYNAGNVASQLGFNRVLQWPARGGIVASHSELGIAFWKSGETGEPTKWLKQPAKTVEILDDDHLIFASGNKLFATDLQEVTSVPTESLTEIAAILGDENGFTIVHDDSTICRLDRSALKNDCVTRRAQGISSAALLPWVGNARLLLASGDGSLDCIGFDDSLVTQYQSPHRGLRAVCASESLVAALSGDRQRLIFWNTWDGRRPIQEVFLATLTRHRAAGISFG